MINPGQLNNGFISPFSPLALLWSGERSDLLSGKAEDVRPGEEKAPGRNYFCLSGDREEHLTRHGMYEMGGVVLK